MTLPAIILNEPYATKVMTGEKFIETRMRRFSFTGDILICCDKGKSKDSVNAGKALCVVYWNAGIPMTEEHEQGACIECVPGRYAFPLSNRRLLSYNFEISKYVVTKNFQGIFEVRIPDFVTINPTSPTNNH